MPSDPPRIRKCLTMEAHSALAARDDVYRTNRRALEKATVTSRLTPRTTVIRVPVVVHILYNNDEENISDVQVRSQIDVLNDDFRMRNSDAAKTPEPFRSLAADAMIEFALAARDPQGRPTNGIVRTRTSVSRFIGEPDELDRLIKFDGSGSTAWPASDYLNLWVCSLDGELLGYAQFPGGPQSTDGVVIANYCFGTSGTAKAPFNCGRTATHEIGHWLNLLHIGGDDGAGCTRSDNVSDTPNQADQNSGKPEFPHVTCNNGPHGDMFMNYMDYVDDDAMFMFTRGQTRRMDTALRTARASIIESQGLVPVDTRRLELADPERSAGPLDLLDEIGTRTQTVFDGVSWVSYK